MGIRFARARRATVLVVCIFAFHANVAYAQDDKEDEALPAWLSGALANEDAQTIGTLGLRGLKVMLSSGDSASVQHVEINVTRGLVTGVRLVTSSTLPLEMHGYIPLMRLSEASDTLRTMDDSLSVPLNDVVTYLPSLRHKDHVYAIDDLIVLDAQNLHYSISVDMGLSAMFDFAVYTDAFALLGEAGNGLVQTEATAILHMPYRQTLKSRFAFQQLFSYYGLQFVYKRFDSENKRVSVTDSTIDMLALDRSSFLSAHFVMNIMQVGTGNFAMEYNGGVGYGLSNIEHEDGNSERVTYQKGFITQRIRIRKTPFFGIGLTNQLAYGTIVELNDRHLFDSKNRMIITVGFDFFYRPSGRDNGVFGRISTNTSDDDSYTVLQLGYSSSLNKIGL